MTQGKYCDYLRQRDSGETEDRDPSRGGPNLRTIRELKQADELNSLYLCALTGLECVAKHTYKSFVDGFKETTVQERYQQKCPGYDLPQDIADSIKKVSLEKRKSELEKKLE